MTKSPFLIKGNLCGDRVRIARALQKPAMKQTELALKIQLMGMDMSPRQPSGC